MGHQNTGYGYFDKVLRQAMAGVYAAVFLSMYGLEKRRDDPRAAMTFQLRELGSPALIALACFF